jgi:hypothetical protein
MSVCRVTDREVWSGSRLPGSEGSKIVAVWPLATWDADELAVADEPALADEPELAVELEPLEQAATVSAAANRAAAVVRTLLRTMTPSLGRG